jgi:alkylation response protein AidB-like acyl-CoA dehydrogenase
MTAPAIERPIITDDDIARFGGRAADYDRENRFFSEDFEELRAAGYLKLPIPKDLGGHGMSVAEVAREQRRLAYRAPATALATNMHLYWMGVAADMRRLGDPSLEWALAEGAAGEVYAAGHGERGNDFPLFFSTARAERTDGGYKLSGHKMFGSLGPVWTRLGIHAQDNDDARGPQVVHVFMPRDTAGYRIDETWDTLGMRPTRSDDTILEGAFVPDKYVGRVIPAGTADLFILSIFIWAEITFGSIYLGIADRARDLAFETAGKRTSLALTRPMKYHPEVQHSAADMIFAMEPAGAYIDSVAKQWSEGPDMNLPWPMMVVAAKHVAVEAAKKVVDLAMAMSGGTGMFKSNELERLYRDVRCGGFHPANSILAPEVVGKVALGIDLGEQPRWG